MNDFPSSHLDSTDRCAVIEAVKTAGREQYVVTTIIIAIIEAR